MMFFSWQYSRPATRQATKNPKNQTSMGWVLVKYNELTGGLLIEFPVVAQMVPQVAAVQQIHDQVQVFSILEGVVHVDKEGAV